MKHNLFKILSIAMICSLLTGCTVLEKYSFESNSVDLTQFGKQGIFVTTGDLSREYSSLSIVVAICYDGYIPKESNASSRKKNRENVDDLYVNNSGSSFDNPNDFEYKRCLLNDLFSELITKAKDAGANGIIKLEIRNISKSQQIGIEVVGLAIKIKE